MINWLAEHWKDLALIATGVVTAASVIVRLTPSKVDDAWLDKVLSFLRILSLTPPEKEPEKKPPGELLPEAA